MDKISRAEFDVYLRDLADEARKEREFRDKLTAGSPPAAPEADRSRPPSRLTPTS